MFGSNRKEKGAQKIRGIQFAHDADGNLRQAANFVAKIPGSEMRPTKEKRHPYTPENVYV
jgi:hypothetical protein